MNITANSYSWNDTAELGLELLKVKYKARLSTQELTLDPPGYSRTRACVSGARSSSGSHEASELSSGVLVVSIDQLSALRRVCAACVG